VNAVTAFDALAKSYDTVFTNSVLGRVYRDASWRWLDEAFEPGQQVLESGCGTGEDAIHLAQRGVRVVATDPSLAMIEATRAKSEAAGLGHMVTALQADAEQVHELAGQFDGAFSSFGAFNLLPRLDVAVERLADACEVSEGEIVEALARLREHYAEGFRGVVLREVAGGFTLATDPIAERAARRLLARPRTPPLTQAQAECLAIVAYLQPVSRPEVARIRGVASESAVGTLLERGLIEESGRSRFGAVMYRTTELFEKLFGLSGLDALPDPAAFDPTPEDESDIRERLLRAGEARARQA